jgi:hypothetical protein
VAIEDNVKKLKVAENHSVAIKNILATKEDVRNNGILTL